MNGDQVELFLATFLFDKLNTFFLSCNSSILALDGCGDSEPLCEYLYSGQGLQYQILAGPAFVAVFTVAGLGHGYLADRFNR